MEKKGTFSDTYYKITFKGKFLNKDEELKLILQAKQGDLKAQNKLLKHNSPFIMKQIRPCHINNRFDENDLFQEASIGFIKAIKRFNIHKKISLRTFAKHYMDKNIGDYIYKNTYITRLPLYLKHLFKKISRLEKNYIHENNGNEPDLRKLAAENSIKKEIIEKYIDFFTYLLPDLYDQENDSYEE